MARINLEDQFWDEIAEVAAKIGSDVMAIGYAVKFIRASQQAYKRGRLVTKEEFKQKFHEALVPTFAVEMDHGFQAVGSEKHFGWLRARAEAGKKGGLARNDGVERTEAVAKIRTEASGQVNAAVKAGRISRPDKCESCGADCKPHAHHENYENPMEFVWLCTKCHGATHSRENNRLRASKPTATDSTRKPLPLPLPLKLKYQESPKVRQNCSHLKNPKSTGSDNSGTSIKGVYRPVVQREAHALGISTPG